MKAIRTWINLMLLLPLAIISCEDKISPTLESAEPILAVDAWLNNNPGAQVIVLTLSQSYFDGTIPPAATGAVVSVNDDKGNTYSFTEDAAKPGNYVWKPVGSEVFGIVGSTYKLSIQLKEEIFESSSKMGRVPKIDSITFDKTKRTGSTDSVTRAEFWSTDPKGIGDAYWVRSYKNGVPLNKPSEINIAYDAGFSAGSADGVVFITPIRRGINSNDRDSNDKPISPIVPGDSMNVQIHSITLQAFNYLNQVGIQTDRPGGFQELFATPLANVSTNILNTKTGGSKALGFFNVSAVSTAGKTYRKK
jgi:Domain of unknown function (DUF4249)